MDGSAGRKGMGALMTTAICALAVVLLFAGFVALVLLRAN
jgi:hypothetical protein